MILLLLVLACADGGKAIDSLSDTGDSAATEDEYLTEGFEGSLTDWEFDWETEWGGDWSIEARAVDLHLYVGAYVDQIDDDTVPGVYRYQHPEDFGGSASSGAGADDCYFGCDGGCDVPPERTYRITSGVAEVTVNSNRAELRLVDVVLTPDGFTAPELNIVEFEVTEIPMVYCETDPYY